MKLFVTGGAGFIGSNFIRYWLQNHASDNIVNFDALTYAGCRESLADVEREFGARYAFVKGDIRDFGIALSAMKEHAPDIIVNFAAESHNSRAILEPGLFMETNALGTQRLLEAARQAGVDRFHHISTCEVYGDLALDSKEKFREDAPYRPHTPYNASKAAADMIARAYYTTFGLPVTISNAANNYGPFQFPEKLIPHFAVKAIMGEKMPLYKSSRHRREWVHVADHCRGIAAVLAKGRAGETYNIGGEFEADIETVADKILGILGLDASYKGTVEDRPGHDRRYLLDSSKIRRELGWKPEIDFDRGLRETVEWYRTNRPWWQPLLGRLAVREDNWKK